MPINNIELPIIETDRLILQAPHVNDAAEVFANWCSSDKVTKYLTFNSYQNEDDVKKYIESILPYPQADPSSYQWFIFLKDEKQLIGAIDLVRYNKEDKCYELCYVLGDNWWGRNIMSEAAQAVVSWAFSSLPVNTIIARYIKENRNSGRVMEKIGMKFQKEYVSKDKLGNEVVFCQYKIDNPDDNNESYLNLENNPAYREMISHIAKDWDKYTKDNDKELSYDAFIDYCSLHQKYLYDLEDILGINIEERSDFIKRLFSYMHNTLMEQLYHDVICNLTYRCASPSGFRNLRDGGFD